MQKRVTHVRLGSVEGIEIENPHSQEDISCDITKDESEQVKSREQVADLLQQTRIADGLSDIWPSVKDETRESTR